MTALKDDGLLTNLGLGGLSLRNVLWRSFAKYSLLKQRNLGGYFEGQGMVAGEGGFDLSCFFHELNTTFQHCNFF